MTQIPESARRRMQTWSAEDHPDADLLTGFAEQSLAATERERVMAHLAACATCRDIVSMALPEIAEPEVVAPKPHGWFQWPALRWAALAATVIVVGAAVSTLVPRRRQSSEEVSVKTGTTQNAPTAANETAPKAERQEVAADRKSSRAIEAKKKADAIGQMHEQARATASMAPPPPPPPPPSGNSANANLANAKRADLDKSAGAAAPANQPASKDGGLFGAVQPVVVAGKVTDPSGAVVPNALVKITNADTKQSAAARTDSSGTYKFAAVAPGSYSVEATAPGMETAKNEVQVGRDVSQNLTLKPAAAAETVEVAAGQPGAAGGVMGGAAAKPTAKSAPAAPPPAQAANADAVDALRAQTATQEAVGGPITKARRYAAAAARWRVGSKGSIERSTDGRNWDAVVIDPGVTFRAMSSNDGELWAGGTGGALFHSADAGRTWSRVKVGSEGMWVAETITAVDFPSARTGYVTTASGATWFTQDAGHTWQRRQ